MFAWLWLQTEVLFTPSEVLMSDYRLYGSYLSSESVLVRPAGHWGPLRSLPPELQGASWEVRGCGELCWEMERSGRGCCCSLDDDPHVGYCRWQPEAHLGSWGLSSRTHTGTGISCTLRGKHTQSNTSDHHRNIHMAIICIFIKTLRLNPILMTTKNITTTSSIRINIKSL